MQIDQEVLCEFCKGYNDSNMANCEGSDCEDMKNIYLEDSGIDLEEGERYFKDLKLGDKLYYCILDKSTPEMQTKTVKSIEAEDKKGVIVCTKDPKEDGTYSKAEYRVIKDKTSRKYVLNAIFINKEEAKSFMLEGIEKIILKLAKELVNYEPTNK